MIRTLLATTAIAALMTAGAIAQTTTPAAPAAPMAPATTEAPAAPATTEAAPAAGATVESGAMEETDTDEPWNFENGYVAVDSDNLGSELIDQPVFSSTGDDAEEIGNISDIIFSEDGRISGVVIGVGGFLGIGEKNVAVPFDMLEFTLAADNTERWVVPTTADALTAAPDFVWEEDEPADGDAMAPADGTAPAAGTTAPADTMAPAAPADTMAPAAPATN
jgi:sporulation protein YlmC with PRC-barrel domain